MVNQPLLRSCKLTEVRLVVVSVFHSVLRLKALTCGIIADFILFCVNLGCFSRFLICHRTRRPLTLPFLGLIPKFDGIPLPASVTAPVAPAPVAVAAPVAPVFAPVAAVAPVAAAVPVAVSPVVAAPAPAAAAPTSSAEAASMVITEESKQHYKRVFASIDTDNDGFLSGAQAREVFTKSNLAVQDLGLIWGLADVNKDGRLDFPEFAIAFFLIQWRLASKEIPSAIPASLFTSVGLAPPIPASASAPAAAAAIAKTNTPTVNAAIASAANVLAHNPLEKTAPVVSATAAHIPSTTAFSSAGSGFGDSFGSSPSLLATPVATPLATAPTPVALAHPVATAPLMTSPTLSPEWLITAEQRETYRGYFSKAVAQDPSGNGYVTAATARTLLSRSQLPNNVLAKIWSLSDADADGKLSQDEFMVSMHLINVALAGTTLPDRLPDGFVASIRGVAASAPATTAFITPTVVPTTTFTSPAPVAPIVLSAPVGPDPVHLAQQARMEEERREAERIKQQLLQYLREKSQLIEQLRSTQQRCLTIGQQYIQADQAYLQQEESVREMELQIERMKIRGASIREKTVLAQQKLDALQEQKSEFDALQQRRAVQATTEQEAVQKLTEQVQQNQQAVVRVQQDNQNLRRQIEEAKKQRTLSQKVDPDILRAKLTVAASHPAPATTPATTAPVTKAPPTSQQVQFFDDFGTTQPFDQRPARPGFFPADDPFPKTFHDEHDRFGKGAAASVAPVLPKREHAQPVPQPADDFFAPANSHSGIAVTPPISRALAKKNSQIEIAVLSETPVSPDEDFFRGGVSAAPVEHKPAAPVKFPAADDDFFGAPKAPPAAAAAPANDFFTPAPSTNPFPDADSDFTTPTAPASSLAVPDAKGKMKNRSVADLFGGTGDDLFAAPNPSTAPTVAAAEPNPFGGDFFTGPSASAAPARVEEDDFFKPLSDEGQREGVPVEFADSGAPAATSTGFKPFAENLFD